MTRSALDSADRAASAQSDAPIDGVVSPCRAGAPRFAIEVEVVGEDDAPLAGERVELVNAAGAVSRTATDARGVARFDGLLAGAYHLSLHDLDADAWEDRRRTALPEQAARSQGDRVFAAASRPAAAPPHTVIQGDCLASIAFRHGFFPATLDRFAGNSALKERRKTLYVLDPGDVVAIPEKRYKRVDVATGQRCQLRRRGVPEVLRRGFLDHRHRPRRGLAYVLHVESASGEAIPDVEGTLDADGFLTAFIPPDARLARIRLNPGEWEEVYTLALGHLCPVDTVLGVQARLHSLALYHGPEDGEYGPETRRAVARFQETSDLPITGEMDATTRAALVSRHRC